jgi:hypothetical protein
MTQSAAPPMMEFPCGQPASRGNDRVAHVNFLSEARVRFPT